MAINDWDEVDNEIVKEAIAELFCGRAKFHRQRVRRIAAVVAFIVAVIVLSLSFSGCGTKLAPEGPYHGDTFLFTADKVLVDSKDDLSGFLKWEMQNRSVLASNKLQSVTAAADTIRTNAPLWFKVAYDSRNNYSNAMALRLPTVTQTSNSLAQSITLLQSQTLSTRALTNSVTLK